MGELEKLAMISDGLQQVLPDSKTTILFEFKKEVFSDISKKLNPNGSVDDKKFKIDISGMSFYFISEEAEL
jgi:hypothetical protein